MVIGISGKIGSGKDTVAKIIQLLSEESNLDKWKWNNEEDILHDINVEPSDSCKWEIRRFADKLKDTVCDWIGCTRAQLEDREFKEKPLGEEWNKYVVIPANSSEPLSLDSREKAERIALTYGLRLSKSGKVLEHSSVREIIMTPRKMMQLLGTEAGRKIIHPNIWVNTLMNEYIPYLEKLPTDSNANVQKYHREPKWLIPDTRFPNEAQAVRDRGGILIRVNRPPSLETNRLPDSLQDMREKHPSETALDEWTDWDYLIENDGTIEQLLTKVKEIYNELDR